MKKNFRTLLSIVFGGVFILLICYFIIDTKKYDRNKYDTKEVVSSVNNIIDVAKIEDELSFNKIIELQNYYDNTDIKSIISIDGLDSFNYPVVQTSDNDYYLNHNYYKESDAYGAIYADYRSNLEAGRKILIFGHSSTKKNVPFNELENYEKKDYYEQHKYINLETETNTYRYEIFSVYIETSDFTYMNMNFDSNKDWFLHILELRKKSLYTIDVDLNMDDDILILQTCSNNSKYQKYSKKYLLIVSRRVK